MEKYKTKKLYVVKPSIVISDETKKLGHNTKNDEIEYKHIVKFENNSKNIGIALPTKHAYVYKSLFNDTCYFKGMGHHCVEGDYHIGIYNDDIMLLVKYLYIQSVSNPKWTRELEEYIISLKPYYNYDELSKIYKQIEEPDENIKTKTLANKYVI